jgi:hypothetical protein
MNKLALGCVILAAGAGSALAAPSAFDGRWKFNPAASKLTGDTFTYAKTPKGYRYSNGATVAYDFAIDGKDYPTLSDRTVAWTSAGAGSWDTVTKAHGVVLTKTRRTISADGKTMTASYTEYWPSGAVVKEGDVYTRVTGGSGLAGEWKNVKVNAAADTLEIATPAPGRYEIRFPNFKETIAGRTDGAPAPITGPTIPPGAMAAYRAVAPGRWEYAITLEGKTYSRGVMALGAGGKTLTRTTWVPGKEAEKSVEVYDRL